MNDTELLRKVSNLVRLCENESSHTYKKQLLAKCSPEVVFLLGMVYNPQTVFYITSKSVLAVDWYAKWTANLIPTLKSLSSREITGDDAAAVYSALVNTHPEFKQVLLRILDKDLGCGIHIKTINSVYPGLIFDFKSHVPLAITYTSGAVDFDTGDYFVSQKLDGVRCLAIINKKEIVFKSRNGNTFHTLANLARDFKLFGIATDEPLVLDGELCIHDTNGNENFKSIVSEIRRKDHTISNPILHVFDVYTLKEFYSGSSEQIYSEKPSVYLNHFGYCKRIKWLRQVAIADNEDFQNAAENLSEIWEGMMLRKNAPTMFKRSKNLLKYKLWQEREFIVTGIEVSKKRIDDVAETCVGALVLDFDGYSVEVGTGLSDQQRIDWFQFPEKIIGKCVTVRYFEVSTDKQGKRSLRFTSLKGIRDYE